MPVAIHLARRETDDAVGDVVEVQAAGPARQVLGQRHRATFLPVMTAHSAQVT
jgi:hypothetical protein